MTLSLAEKKTVVKEVAEAASGATSAVLADYRGLTVNQMTQLRVEARKKSVYLRVVPNTLSKRAFEDTEFSCLNDYLVGPTIVAFSMDSPGDSARLIKDFCKTAEALEVKALSVGGKAYEADQLSNIARLPTRHEALTKLACVLKAPVEKFVRTTAEPISKLVRTLSAVKDQKG